MQDKATSVCQILNYNDWSTTQKLVDSIIDYKNIDYILIIDNNSTDNSLYQLKNLYSENKKIKIVKTNKNGGYGYGNNFGVKYATKKLHAKYVIITNPDCYFSDSMIEKMKNLMDKKDAALVSGVQTINNEVIKKVAWRIPTAIQCMFSDTKLENKFKYTYSNEELNSDVVEVDCVPGAMFLVDPQKFLSVGGYDERMFLYCEESVIGWKFKKNNMRTYLITNLTYKHMHSMSINKNIPSIYRQQKYLMNSRFLFIKYYIGASPSMQMIARIFFKIKLQKIKNNI